MYNKTLTAEIKKIISEEELDCSVEDFEKIVDWFYISIHQKLSEDFIREFQDKVNWIYISKYQQLSEDFIREFQDKVDWYLISARQKLSENFIRKFKDKVDWYLISARQKLSENFIRKFKDKVAWFNISGCQKLSENFIREFQYRINWKYISAYQQLSEDFIKDFQDYVVWQRISKYQKLSKNFIEQFQDKLDIKLHRRKHKPKTHKQKLKEVKAYAKKHNLNFDGIFLHAFRDHDMNGCGLFNKTISYKPGEYYRDWHCDMDQNDGASFGLGIYPNGNTKVLVSVGDWGVAVKSSVQGKARVWGFTLKTQNR